MTNSSLEISILVSLIGFIPMVLINLFLYKQVFFSYNLTIIKFENIQFNINLDLINCYSFKFITKFFKNKTHSQKSNIFQNQLLNLLVS